MSIPAETAIRDWINARAGLTGEGMPLEMGAFLRQQRSPETGAYVVVWRQSEGVSDLVAEESLVSVARMQFLVFAGTEDASEKGAAALRTAFETLSGCPEPCGKSGHTVVTSDNLVGPFFVDNPAGEPYCFQVNGDFVLIE